MSSSTKTLRISGPAGFRFSTITGATINLRTRGLKTAMGGNRLPAGTYITVVMSVDTCTLALTAPDGLTHTGFDHDLQLAMTGSGATFTLQGVSFSAQYIAQ